MIQSEMFKARGFMALCELTKAHGPMENDLAFSICPSEVRAYRGFKKYELKLVPSTDLLSKVSLVANGDWRFWQSLLAQFQVCISLAHLHATRPLTSVSGTKPLWLLLTGGSSIPVKRPMPTWLCRLSARMASLFPLPHQHEAIEALGQVAEVPAQEGGSTSPLEPAQSKPFEEGQEVSQQRLAACMVACMQTQCG
jgi:hypothetical protein